MAKKIREEIWEETALTASAGVAPNKFLAKIASDWRKPNGLFVIQPKDVEGFLAPLAVGRIPGVGRVTEGRMKEFGIATVGDLLARDLGTLEGLLRALWWEGCYGLARGIDHSPVVPDRVSKSISAEDTFERDIPLVETDEVIRRLADKVWNASRRDERVARTVVLKLKTAEFATLTRSHTPGRPPGSVEELTEIALGLRDRVELSSGQRFRLVGVGLSNFRDVEEAPPSLLAEDAEG